MDDENEKEMGEEVETSTWMSIRFFVWIILGLTALGVLFFAVA